MNEMKDFAENASKPTVATPLTHAIEPKPREAASNSIRLRGIKEQIGTGTEKLDADMLEVTKILARLELEPTVTDVKTTW